MFLGASMSRFGQRAKRKDVEKAVQHDAGGGCGSDTFSMQSFSRGRVEDRNSSTTINPKTGA